jgi:hypothetical protein
MIDTNERDSALLICQLRHRCLERPIGHIQSCTDYLQVKIDPRAGSDKHTVIMYVAAVHPHIIVLDEVGMCPTIVRVEPREYANTISCIDIGAASVIASESQPNGRRAMT